MKVDDSFATEHSNEIPTFGVASSAICRAIFTSTISCTFFSPARTCRLMLLNSIYCIQHSCPSAHTSDFACLFHLWQTNFSSFFKGRKKERLLNIQDVQRKGISCVCDFLFVCCKYQYSDSGIRQTSWTSAVLFINLSSLKERECFQVFLILAYTVYSLFTFVLVAWYVITLLKYQQCSGYLKYMMYYRICGLKNVWLLPFLLPFDLCILPSNVNQN